MKTKMITSATLIVNIGECLGPKQAQLITMRRKDLQSRSWLSVGFYLILYPECLDRKGDIWLLFVIPGCGLGVGNV